MDLPARLGQHVCGRVKPQHLIAMFAQPHKIVARATARIQYPGTGRKTVRPYHLHDPLDLHPVRTVVLGQGVVDAGVGIPEEPAESPGRGSSSTRRRPRSSRWQNRGAHTRELRRPVLLAPRDRTCLNVLGCCHNVPLCTTNALTMADGGTR